MLFDITSKDLPEKMYPGMIITYKVSPFLNIKMNWVTEITQVKDKHFFVDEQRMGPYSMWHHQHFFEEQDGGVMMTDIVSYIPPFGILGVIANSMLIKRQLESIFDYRFKVMDKKFNN
jgi:ligand-binding SRPBCC domain-containing protein